MMASTTTSYPPNPQHDPAFQPINNFHGEPHREFPPRARVDSWHEPAPGLRNITNGPTPSDQTLNPALHARPPSHSSSRRPSLAVESGTSSDVEKQHQPTAPTYSGPEKQTSPHAPAPGSHPMQSHRSTTVPPLVTKREQNLQHLPASQTAPTSPSAPIHYSHHPIQPSQAVAPPPSAPPPTSHPPPANYPPLQPFTPNAPPPQMIAPVPPVAPPQNYHHHSAPPPPHMGYAAQPPNIRRPSVAPGLNMPESEDISPMTSAFSYHLSGSTPFPQRRKPVRAAQACDACRTRKAKCDEGRPACGFCKDNNSACVYREVPPPKQDRTMIMIQERVQNIEKMLQNNMVLTLLKEIHAAVSSKSTENQSAAESSAASSPDPDTLQDETVSAALSKIEQAAAHIASAPPAPPSQLPTPTQVPANFSVPPGTSHPVETTKDDDNYITIPHKHNTAAHKLLRWKSIQGLLDGKYPENYVMGEEIKRGSLRFRGRGEGDMELDEMREEAYDEPQHVDYYQQDDFENTSMQSMRGVGGRIGSGSKEILRVDTETAIPLLNNFLENLYILHPFLNKGPLVELVQRFSEKHGVDLGEAFGESESMNPGHTISPGSSFGSMATSAMMEQSQYPSMNQYPGYSNQLVTPTKAGSKRKRDSNIQPGAPRYAQGEPNSFYRQATPDFPVQRIPQSLNSAIVLLVLALGAITGYRTPVPGPLPRFHPANINQAMPDQFKHPAAIQQTQGYHSKEPLLNIDVIPGLAYLEKALQILALHEGRSEVEYVQACLLAGLYWGQLGRPMDSWKWISSACMACQIMINIRLPPEGSNIVLRDTMVRTFWSCVQLESDLLAELDVPRSGITRLEGSESLRMSIDGKIDDNLEMWLYFMAQYHIRKILNQVHSELYKPSKAHSSSLATAQALMESLEAWRNTLPAPLQWSDNDPPSSDINAARLRAKYYGAKYVINRPFVEYFIHKSPTSSTNTMNPTASPALSLSSLSQSSPPTSAHTPLNSDNRRTSVGADEHRETPASYTTSCKTCLDAAMKSTAAFHSFDAATNRPILTNIFGTAHAQFGNLLVLQAAYRHPKLKQFVDRERLGELLGKTIVFLRTLSPISPSLAQDLLILEDASTHLDFFHST